VTAASFLFVPAHEPRKVQKAMAAGSDAVILDLEDAVPDSRKAAARAAVAALRPPANGPELWVRVNSDTRHFGADLDTVHWGAVAGALLPKAERPDVVRQLEAAGARRIILIMESAAGMAALCELASASSRVERCALGTLDLSLDLGLLAVDDVDESELIWHVRAGLVLDSRAAGLQTPIDGVRVRLDDEAGLRRTCERVHQLGYSGKLLIHPKQIAVANSVFKPNQDDLDLAREIVEAYAVAEREGRGAIQVRGNMVDRPVVERARSRLERWVNPKP
jgi:citrate lyase subunit beta/citryl-CoA lyase